MTHSRNEEQANFMHYSNRDLKLLSLKIKIHAEKIEKHHKYNIEANLTTSLNHNAKQIIERLPKHINDILISFDLENTEIFYKDRKIVHLNDKSTVKLASN
jgi:hypothetical protein